MGALPPAAACIARCRQRPALSTISADAGRAAFAATIGLTMPRISPQAHVRAMPARHFVPPPLPLAGQYHSTRWTSPSIFSSRYVQRCFHLQKRYQMLNSIYKRMIFVHIEKCRKGEKRCQKDRVHSARYLTNYIFPSIRWPTPSRE